MTLSKLKNIFQYQNQHQIKWLLLSVFWDWDNVVRALEVVVIVRWRMGEICRQGYILMHIPPHHTRISTFMWILPEVFFFVVFFVFKGVKGGTQCTGHWWGWKKFLFRNLIQKPKASFSNPNLILTHWPDWCFCTGFGRCSQTMYLEAVIPGVQTGASGAWLVLREAGAEKCLGSDAFACRYNAFCRDWSRCASFLSTPHVPVSVQPCRPSSTPPDLVIIVLPVYLLRVFFPDSLLS